MSLPEIGAQRQLLLIYDASAEFNTAGLKGKIIEFLLNYEVKVEHVQAHMNSSLYFRVDNPFSDTMLRKLAADFEAFISQLENEFEGRVFWLINTVAQLKLDEPRSVRAATLGKGNKTLSVEVAKEIKKIPVVIREIKETPVVASETKEIPVDHSDKFNVQETQIKETPFIPQEDRSEEKANVLKGLRRGPKKD